MTERGRWDRAASNEDRARAHRRIAVEAAAKAVFEVGRGLTVSDVVERAGIGRNTLYLSFRDLGALLHAAEVEALSHVERAFTPSREARTPIERLRTMALAWLSLAAREPYLVHLLIRGDGRPRGAHSRLRDVIVRSLESVAAAARAAGVVGRPVDAGRLRGVAGAFVAFAEEAIEEKSRIDLGDRAQDLAGFALRAFR